MATPFLDLQGNPISQDQVLGNSALVLLQDGVAVKTPLRCLWSNPSDVEGNLQSLRREQDVYCRLQSSDDDRLNGSRPSHELQLSWCLEMACIFSYIHDLCVLVADIVSRNSLLDSNLFLKFCDFSEASLLPLGSHMEAVDDTGFTTQIDIGLLGAVMHEIVTGESAKIDLFRDTFFTDGRAYRPKREYLPETSDIWLGWIIEGCWGG
ncbi:hypothetical protein P170DRAFT_445071 [Aspergillus steynii IBT 23096]|uniref:Protein kinase domain-containing protein n=1 Tax=Aspergillus steynii IBT 23096 TaxID=1392250 RepID=A0A2I2GK83_9EURO|nr:uncharacterized protein P170DRAFT_445071 [Aspergillus steynii IBT 23096]PLB53282.1 hypothetical protein P170DRAFT_445071 [Aspergillus steynii IBT 23096]